MKKEASTIVPVVREAVRVEIKPQPSPEEAKNIAEIISKAWKCDQYKYIDLLIKATGDSSIRNNIKCHEDILQRMENTTHVIDFPLITHYNGDKIKCFDTRLCISICTREMTTKCWSRVSSPFSESQTRLRYSLNDLKDITERYHKIAEASSEWLAENVINTYKDHFNGSKDKLSSVGTIVISAIGVKDESLKDDFESLLENRDNAPKILDKENLQKKMIKYLGAVSEKPQYLPSIIKGERIDSYHQLRLISPQTVDIESGYKENRAVLYFLNELPRRTLGYGIAFDDSISGDLVVASASKVSRHIGPFF
jgi:hypothetical protein